MSDEPSMPHKLCVTITTGRSGTKYLHNLFCRNYPGERGILHESLHPGRAKTALYHRRFDGSALADPDVRGHFDSLDALRGQGPVVDFGWILGCLAPALPARYGSNLCVLMLTAHPVSVAASLATRGHYSRNRNPAWAISAMHDSARFSAYRSRWADMTPFERSLFRWLEITSLGLEFRERHPEVQLLSMRSDELFADGSARVAQIAQMIGLPPRELSFDVPKNEALDSHVERRPLGDEWRRVYDMPEVMELATSLGFDMSPEHLAVLARRYQLNGWMARLRHASGYWEIRERLGRLRARAFGWNSTR